eukprot:scaffold84855_cov60-Cyclotella_meneghiniana.AAC.1
MKLSFLSLALAPFAMVRGDDLSKYKVLNPTGGGCVDSQYRAYSYIEPEYFYYSKYPGLGYSGLVEKCAGWCLQNGPPKNMIGFETYTKEYAEDGYDDDGADPSCVDLISKLMLMLMRVSSKEDGK